MSRLAEAPRQGYALNLSRSAERVPGTGAEGLTTGCGSEAAGGGPIGNSDVSAPLCTLKSLPRRAATDEHAGVAVES